MWSFPFISITKKDKCAKIPKFCQQREKCSEEVKSGDKGDVDAAICSHGVARTHLNRPGGISCEVSGGGDGTKARSSSRPQTPGTTGGKGSGKQRKSE